MPNINVQVSGELLEAVKLACVRSGERQKEFVVRALEMACGVKKSENPPIVNEAPCGKDAGYPSEAPRADIEVLKAICRGELPTKQVSREELAEQYPVAETPKIEVCPEEGDPMVWNRILRRHQCPTCGYQGKTVRL